MRKRERVIGPQARHRKGTGYRLLSIWMGQTHVRLHDSHDSSVREIPLTALFLQMRKLSLRETKFAGLSAYTVNIPSYIASAGKGKEIALRQSRRRHGALTRLWLPLWQELFPGTLRERAWRGHHLVAGRWPDGTQTTGLLVQRRVRINNREGLRS